MERMTSHSRASCSRTLRPVPQLQPGSNCLGLSVERWIVQLHRRKQNVVRQLKAMSDDDAPVSNTTKTIVAESQSAPASPAHLSGISPAQASTSADSPPRLDGSLLPELGDEHNVPAGKPSGPVMALISGLGVLFLLGGGYVFKDQIKAFLDFFIGVVDDYGPWGYAAYALVYIALEVLALPAIPLTMTAGVIFGTNEGTIIVSVASTIAATIAFVIARYLARDKVRGFAYRHPKFKAIDRAIGKDGLKFVTLLRLSPLLPLAASNYLYGLTSVDLGSYVLGSWIGMLPGTYAYVHAGTVGRAVLDSGKGSMTIDTWQIALGLGATLLALAFIGKVAANAVEEADQDDPPTLSSRGGESVSDAQPNDVYSTQPRKH